LCLYSSRDSDLVKAPLNMRVQLAIFVALLGLAALLWAGRERVTDAFAAYTGRGGTVADQGPTKRPSAQPVVVEPVRRAEDLVQVEAIATARAKRFVTLYPEAPGQVVEIAVTTGTHIKRGEIILLLDAQAETLAVDVARSKYADAQRQMKRAEDLLQSNVNSNARVEDAATQVAQARFELLRTEDALADRTLTAPFDGVVGIPKVGLGDRVTMDTPVITIDDRTALFVEIQVAEQYVSRLRQGQSVPARTPSFADREFEGTVAQIDSRVDPTTRAVMVRAMLDNKADLLRPGMSFAVTLSLPGKTYPTVSELALQWRKGESFVWVIADGKAERVVVRSVKRLNSKILVDGNLSEGDLVVVEGVHRLRPGSAVSYTPPASSQTSEN